MSKETQIPISEELLLEEIRVILKDYFVATIRKAGDELRMRFAGGETFCLTVWRQSLPKRRGRSACTRAEERRVGEAQIGVGEEVGEKKFNLMKEESDQRDEEGKKDFNEGV